MPPPPYGRVFKIAHTEKVKRQQKESILKSLMFLHLLFNHTETLRHQHNVSLYDKKIPFFSYLSNILLFWQIIKMCYKWSVY